KPSANGSTRARLDFWRVLSKPSAGLAFLWCRQQGSNPRPPDYKSEYVGFMGFLQVSSISFKGPENRHSILIMFHRLLAFPHCVSYLGGDRVATRGCNAGRKANTESDL